MGRNATSNVRFTTFDGIPGRGPTIAVMHGEHFSGDGAQAPPTLADDHDARLTAASR